MTATLRNRGLLAITLTAATGLLAAGCSTSAAPVPDRQAGSVTVPQLPACTSEVMADTKAAITSATEDRIAAEKIPLNNGTPLANNSAAVKRIAKAAMLDCEPTINVNNPSANPPNVATIQGIIDLQDWGRMIDSDSVGAGDAGASKPSGFSTPAESYKTFLTVAGRFPYFCGEKGTWDTVEEACQRELAAMFAHAVQETGSRPAPPGKEPWQTVLFNTREGGCVVNKCSDYDGGKEDFGAPSDAHFYGRGIKQLSYVYNYAAFSASYYGDFRVLVNNPELVGDRADLVLASGIWFAMTTQPPKPSMHDVMVGLYRPDDDVAGIDRQADGSVADRFGATISLINGAIECSPVEDVTLNQNRGANRYGNYVDLLTLFGVDTAGMSAAEKSYNPVIDSFNPAQHTWCTIDNGNPFVADALSDTLPIYFDAGSPAKGIEGSCNAVGWGQAVTLMVSAPGMYATCLELYGPGAKEGVKESEAPESPSPTATPSTPTSPSATESTTPSTPSEGPVTVTFAESANWGSGYCVNPQAENTSGAEVSAWSYEFRLEAGQTVDQPWGMTVTQDGRNVTIVPDRQTLSVGQKAQVGGFCVEGGGAKPTNVVSSLG